MIITIDGPSASGKSTVARILAKELGYYCLYSGLLYRALAYLLMTHELYTDEMFANPKAEHLNIYLDPARFTYQYDESGKAIIMFDGADITPYLKDGNIDQHASILSMNKKVRDILTRIQQKIGKKYHIVIEGRDSGSVVFPYAEYKFFLTATPEERAKRWQMMQEERGIKYSLDQALQELEKRDTRDASREIAPLCVPEGAITIDSTDLDVRQVIRKMISYIG